MGAVEGRELNQQQKETHEQGPRLGTTTKARDNRPKCESNALTRHSAVRGV